MKTSLLSQGTEAIAIAGFQLKYGYRPSDVRSLAGDPPNEENQFLYIPFLDLYQGKVTGKDRDYLFFISRDDKGKWVPEFTPL